MAEDNGEHLWTNILHEGLQCVPSSDNELVSKWVTGKIAELA